MTTTCNVPDSGGTAGLVLAWLDAHNPEWITTLYARGSEWIFRENAPGFELGREFLDRVVFAQTDGYWPRLTLTLDGDPQWDSVVLEAVGYDDEALDDDDEAPDDDDEEDED